MTRRETIIPLAICVGLVSLVITAGFYLRTKTQPQVDATVREAQAPGREEQAREKAKLRVFSDGYKLGDHFGSMKYDVDDDVGRPTDAAIRVIAGFRADDKHISGGQREEWIRGFEKGYADGAKRIGRKPLPDADKVLSSVRDSLHAMLNDPSSLQDLRLVSIVPTKRPDEYTTTVFYRARNAFGALVGQTQSFNVTVGQSR